MLNSIITTFFIRFITNQPDGAVVRDTANGVGGMGFDSRAGQIGYTVATAAMFLRSCVDQAFSRGDGSRRRYGVIQRA